MRKCIGLLFALALIVSLTGCEDLDGSSGVEFSNESTFSVRVTPNGQDSWLEFLLAPGDAREVDIDEDIFFFYQPSNKVWADTSEDGEVVFYNR